MRKVWVELHLDRVVPEAVEVDGGVVVRLGPNMGFEGVRVALESALSEPEWAEFHEIWACDDVADRRFETVADGGLRISR